MQKPTAIFLLGQDAQPLIYSKEVIQEIQLLTDCDGRVHNAQEILAKPEKYSNVQIIFSGWGAPRMDEALLGALPQLKAYFFGAGTVRYVTSDAFWKREILITSAYQANAIPVAEFTVAGIVFSLKRVLAFNYGLKGEGTMPTKLSGVYKGSRVGIISLGAIGRRVCQILSHYDLDLIAYDPYAPSELFAELSVERVADLETLFGSCDVVSLHAPSLPETEALITRKLLMSMPEGATFINTARGAIVDEFALIEVLTERKDLSAMIDVIVDENRYEESPLLKMPNVLLTPHIAGSGGRECHRLGDMVFEELRRYLASEPALTPITEAESLRMA
ncbi:hydroxyacid dehydrogenase [Coraliomargarita sp. SDUM461004]|uniref:Hydroxyacid dehydrogenase n=1 Tax=Thalassobacterium sedimentorum TaxID=3041258 RepID=A0ABU1AGA7_9BACT|nr:hydroxyacid dehydrogenase [Coraliomargarita sp. SDUM461004]MDQ8193865.1 hydroxyacid dehydrogenase [Coraliomargarita sp. SDUM461004]